MNREGCLWGGSGGACMRGRISACARAGWGSTGQLAGWLAWAREESMPAHSLPVRFRNASCSGEYLA